MQPKKVMSFSEALTVENPLQIAGVIHTYAAMLAKEAGFKALYLSGAGVANAQYGLPDIGLTTNTQVAEEIRRITHQVELPILVDADTGFGEEADIAKTVKLFETAGAAALHIEDQTWPKRCGHLAGKSVVSIKEMQDRIKAAVNAKVSKDFVIMARTDALGLEGLNATIERAQAYIAAGAEMIFFEAAQSLEDYQAFCAAIKVPVLANITEFGQTPLFTVQELKTAGVQMILYPLTAFRMMNQAALKAYQTLRKDGTQKSLINDMQTREALYKILNYDAYTL